MAPLISEKIVALLIGSSLKGTMLLAAVLLALRLLKHRSASVRHWLCSMALLSVVIIPALTLLIPAWPLLLPETTNHTAQVFFVPARHPFADDAVANQVIDNGAIASPGSAGVMEAAKNAAPAQQIALPTIPATATPIHIDGYALLLFGWLMGTLLSFERWLLQAERVRQITRRGLPVHDQDWVTLCNDLTRRLKLNRTVALVISDECLVPMTWGLWRPTIVLPCEVEMWLPERRRIVLTHELVHIARWDYLTQWIALLSCAVNWFNPLVWKVARTLTIERERACDDQVLALGTKSSEYAANLMDIAQSIQQRRTFVPGALALVESSDLGKRIRRILDRGQRRHILTRRRSIGLMLALALLLMPLSSVQLSRASQNGPIVLSIAVPPGMSDAIQETVVRDFEASHPGVVVATIDAPLIPDAADGIDAHMTAWQRYANSADVLSIDGYSLALTPHATRAGMMLDLTPLVTGDTALNMDDFYPQLRSSFQWDNGIWALPMGADLVLLNYDQAAFDRAGMTYPDGSWTLTDFINAVTKLSVKDLDGHVTATGFANSGRIFRESLWRSLMGANIVDDSVIPNAPHFDTPGITAVVDAYFQLEQQALIGGDVSSAAMFVDSANRAPPKGHGYSLLPGGKSVLLPYGFGISSGTQHPDLAYELLKMMSARPELSGGIPARKSIARPGGLTGSVAPEMQPIAVKALANSLNYADLRFTDYLNSAWITHPATVKEAVQVTEIRALNDVKAASDRKGTLALQVAEPIVATLPPGKIALNFDIATFVQPLPTRDLWDKVIADFTATDPQVGMVNLRVVSESVSMAAARADCFYLPTNAVPTLSGNLVLNLDPFLTADTSFDRTDYIGNVLAAVQRDNKTYALPVGIEPLILRYNVARFKAANLPEPTNDWSIESLIDALQALKPGSDGQPPMVDNGSGGMFLLALIADYGGLPIDYRTDPPTLHFTDPASVVAIRQVLDLTKNGLIKYTALGNLQGDFGAFPGATTAIYPVSLNGLATKKPPGAAPDKPILFPTGHEYSGFAYNLNTAYISAQSSSPDACYRFLKVIANHPELTASMPVRHSILTSPTFKNSVSADVWALYNQADALFKDARTIPFPLPNQGTITISNLLAQHWLFEAFDAYALNGGDLDAALRDAEGYAKGFLDCAASLPALTLADAGKSQALSNSALPYVECAERADSRLKPILDPLVNGH